MKQKQAKLTAEVDKALTRLKEQYPNSVCFAAFNPDGVFIAHYVKPTRHLMNRFKALGYTIYEASK